MSGINTDGLVVVVGILGTIGAAVVTMIVFVALKLFKVIEWSWVWVTSPGWIVLVLLVAAYVILSLIYGKWT
jgi:hypothetical protein